MAYNVLYGLSMKMAKRNKELKALIKEVISEEEALVQKVASMENNVASLQEENKINANLKQEPAWQKNEHTLIIKEKKDLLKNVDQSLKAPQSATSTKEDSSLLRRTRDQPSTSISQSCHTCGKLGNIFIMCKIKKLSSNGVCK